MLVAKKVFGTSKPRFFMVLLISKDSSQKISCKSGQSSASPTTKAVPAARVWTRPLITSPLRADKKSSAAIACLPTSVAMSSSPNQSVV